MTPQAPRLNQQAWRRLEMAVREKIEAAGRPVHVLTIAQYNPNAPRVKGIPVPAYYEKHVYLDVVECYAAFNDNAAVVQVIPCSESTAIPQTGRSKPKDQALSSSSAE